jgi:hypothetical protein
VPIVSAPTTNRTPLNVERLVPQQDDANGPRPGPPIGALIALLVVVVVAVTFMFIMHRLTEAGRLQDCLASGRTNCAPISTQSQ